MKIFNFLTGKSKIFVLGVIVIVLLTSTIGVVSGYLFSKEDCPPCKESGMELYHANRNAFHETFAPYSGWEALSCAYHKLDEKGDSLGSGAFGIKLYTDEGLAMAAFLEDVENARGRIDKYENSKWQIRPYLIEDTPFDAYEYRIVDLDNNFYEITGIYLLNKNKIYVSTEYHEELADAEKAFDALKKCAFSTVPEGKGNHPPKVTLTFLGHKPGPQGGLGSIEFEAKATDEDGDKLRFRWFWGHKELKEENNDIVTKAAEKDDMTTVHLTMLEPLSGGNFIVMVYDDRGGKHWAYADWHLPPGTGIPVHNLPTAPYIEAAMGKVTLNGKEILPWDICALSPNDIIETAPGKTNGGYAIITLLGGTVKIGSDTHLRFYNKKQLGLFRGRIFIEGKELKIRKKSGRVFTLSQPPNIEVVGPETLEQMIESIEDKELREEWRDKIKQIGTGTGMGKWAGTEFEVIVEDDSTTIFHVFEDVIDVSDVDIKKTVAVGAGETSIVKPNGVPSDPEPFDPDSIDRWWEGWTSATDVQGLTFESRSKPSGSSVQIPLTLNGIEEKIGNMDITLSYDPSILEATG
ncbi:MAG: hypothetical protein IME95_00080, partial [Proteobacteria bacterium]|nr:hypothetical protein [Pseudomonadota bacterium]